MSTKLNVYIKEVKQNLRLSLPLVASWLIYSLTGLIGTAMVARLGTQALAASILVGTIWTALIVFFFGIFSAISVLVSHQYGQKQYHVIGVIIRQAVLIAAISSLPLMLLLVEAPHVFSRIIAEPNVLKLASQYANALAWAVPAIIFLIILENFLNGIGKTKMSLWISIIEVPFEIILVYLFVFGGMGIPAYGIAGVGYGLAASFGITSLILVIFLYYAKFTKPYRIFQQYTVIHYAYLKELLVVGLPIGLMYLIEVSAFTVATYFMTHFSTTTLAAHQISMQYFNFTINIAYAIGQAVSIRIGQAAGSLDRSVIRDASFVSIAFSFIFVSLIALIYIFMPTELLHLDMNPHKAANLVLAQTAAKFLIIVGLFQLCDSIRVIVLSVLRALKDTKFPMFISLISFWLIGLSCAYVAAFKLHLGGQGVWLGLALGVFLGAIILCVRLRKMLKQINLADVIRVE